MIIISNIIKHLPKTVHPVKNAYQTWIDIDGSVYTRLAHGPKPKHTAKPHKLIKLIPYTNQHNGYVYVGIKFNSGYKTVRLHHLVAQTFIPNPHNYKIVGHKNNIKTDCRVANLYWTTVQENTKKAFDDNLAKNDKGIMDSQSFGVIMFDTKTNQKLKEFGSICEANRQTGISKTTIARQAKYHRPVRKPFYFRYCDDETVNQKRMIDTTIYMYDFKTDKLIRSFKNKSQAELITGIATRTINTHIKNGKPKKNARNLKYYFSSNKL